MPDEIVERLRRAYDAWNADDIEAALAFMHPDVEFDFRSSRDVRLASGTEEVYRGHDRIREWWTTSKDPFEYFRSEPQRFIHEREVVVVPVHFEARGRESGAEVEMSFANVWTFRDGLIIKLETYTSVEEALEAAGVED